MTIFTKINTTIIATMIALTAQVNGANDYTQGGCAPNCCKPSCDFYLKAELLYWRPELCGLEAAFGTTAIATDVSTSAITTTTVTESDEEPHSKWSPGFRIGAGAVYECLDIELDWTHFNGRASLNQDEQFGNWKIKYDAVDFTIGRSFCITSCFALKPFIGVRSLRIHQHLRSHLTTIFTALIGSNTVTTDKHDTENFWGVGPQIGLDAYWGLGCNFSLYGSFAVVSYYGDVKGHNCDADTFTSTVSVCHGKKKHCFSNVGTDAALGIRWDRSIELDCFCGCLDFFAKLGGEQHRIYDFSDLGSDGTLSLDGGVFALGVNFRY